MDETLLTIVLVTLAALANILGGVFVVYYKNWPKRALNYFAAFGAGFLLAIALLDLIPETLELDETNAAFVLLGFAIIHVFEHIFSEHFHFGEETHREKHAHGAASMAAFVGLLIHTFLDGASITAGFMLSWRVGILLFSGVLLHKLADGITIASIMLAANRSKTTATMATISLGAATVAGMGFVYMLGDLGAGLTGPILAISAGAFLYVAATDLIPQVNVDGSRPMAASVLVGMITMYLVSVALTAAGFH